jgi:hypothetical protein
MTAKHLNYPRTLHLNGSGIGTTSARVHLTWEELSDRHVVIEEKMDGSEVSFEFGDDLEPVLRYRGSPLDLRTRGGTEKQFDRFKDWFSLNADSFFDLLDTRYRVYGEWLYAAHRIFYDGLPSYFLEFDVLELATGRFLDTPSRRALLGPLTAIHSVKVLADGIAGGLGHPTRLVGRSAFKSDNWHHAARVAAERSGQVPDDVMARIDSSDLAEGVYGKVEEDGEVRLRFKWVRPDFVRSIVESGRHWKEMGLVPNAVSGETPI